MRIDIVIYRYQVIIFIVIIFLTGSINIISKESDTRDNYEYRYPYTVALTFDDGPYRFYTEKLLKILQYRNVKATFFLIGRHVNANPDLAKLISNKGHEIGGHTYTHKNLTKLSDGEILDELNRTREIIFKATGRETRIFRPPGGRYNKKVIQISAENKYEMILWDVLPGDCDLFISDNQIVKKIFEKDEKNIIILLHSGVERTMKLLPEIIDGLRSKGYRFVTVSELSKIKQQNLNLVKKNIKHN